jgi:hypothetical protein
MVVIRSSCCSLRISAAHLDADLGVQVRERLVQQENVGVEDQRSRERHPLLLAARELPGIAASSPPRFTFASPSRTRRSISGPPSFRRRRP